MSQNKQDRKKSKIFNKQTTSLMAVQAKLGLFKTKKALNGPEKHHYLKKNPFGFI